MFLIDSLRTSIDRASPFALHVFLIFGVIFYTTAGAFIIGYLESPERIRAAALDKRQKDLERNEIAQRDISMMTGTQLAQEDPRVHECLRKEVAKILAKTGCEDSSKIDRIVISPIDDCYRKLSVAHWGEYQLVNERSAEDLYSDAETKWTFENALIFSFTVITTIGYGHIVPETTLGRVFVIIYGIFGVPLTLLTIADLGLFIAKGLHYLMNGATRLGKWTFKRFRTVSTPRSTSSAEEKCLKGEKGPEKNEEEEEEEEEDEPRKLNETIALCVLFTLYLVVGARILSGYEPEMDFFKAFYFNFVTLTTIGLGDFVPKSNDYLFVTLVYIGVGLALTTMAVEIMADGLKRLHYFGRKVKSAATVFVWFGGEKMRLDRLIKNLGDQLNIPEEELLNFEMETFVEQAIKVEEGEIACLRRPVVMRPVRPVSYSTIRKSDDSARLHFVDSTRSSKIGTETVGLPPLASETDRSLHPDFISRLQNRRLDSTLDTSRKSTKVRFSQTSFDGSISSMDYSEEDLPTLRV